MTHGHNHYHGPVHSGKRLFGTIVLNVGITAAEIIGGLLTGYLALLADAVHNLSDVAALILAYIGEIGAARPATKRSTYGFKRLEVMTAFISAVALVVIALYIFFEAYRRFLEPQDFRNPTLLLIVAVIGLVGNILSVVILHGSRKRSLNIKTAFLHMFYDALSSLAVIIGAVVIIKTGWNYLDPILAVLIGLMILWSSYDVIGEATMIFMEAAPRGLDVDRVASAIAGNPRVRDVHHLHIWSLSSALTALSCHISLSKANYPAGPEIMTELGVMLHERFGIDHCTIQPELEYCIDNGVNQTPETGES